MAVDATTAIYSMFDGLFHQDLAMEHRRRLAAYRHYWMFYLGKHWTYSRDEGDPVLTINYCRRLLDVLNDFTFKKSFKCVIPDDPSTSADEQEDREFVRYLLEETWTKNHRDLWLLEAAQQGGVTGDLFARVSWETQDPLSEGEPYAKVEVIPSHLVFPEPGGPIGADRKRLKRVIILNPVYETVPESELPRPGVFSPHVPFTTGGLQLGNKAVVIYGEEWVAAEYDEFGKATRPAMVREFRNLEITSERENPLGEIPVVHIPNYPLSGEYYGLSDLVDAAELNRELNEKGTDISDILNYHASPVTILEGAKIKNLERGANRVWGIPTGAKAYNLELSGDLSASVKYLGMIKEALMELIGVPEQAMGKLQNLGNVSGVALAIQYLPLMEKRTVKVQTYGLGLRLINRLILKVTAIGDQRFGEQFDKLTPNKYRNEVVFPNPMPYDEAAELEKARARLELKLSTRANELERMGVSQAEARKILQDALDEEAQETEAMFDANLSRRGQNQNMRGGVPEVRARKVSETAAKKAATLPPEISGTSEK